MSLAALPLRKRLGAWLGALPSIVFPRQGGGRSTGGLMGLLFGTQPGANFDYAREVGDPALNSAAAICLQWIARKVASPQLEVVDLLPDGTEEKLLDHPLLARLEDPNPYYDGDDLWQALSIDLSVDGNAYVLPLADNLGRPRELYWIPHWMMEPRWDPNQPEKWLTHYAYKVDGREYHLLPEQVIHFRNGLDPYRRGRGVGPLYPVLREIFSDNEAATFVAAILRNMGIPGVILQPRDREDEIDGEGRETLNLLWQGFTGDGRGKPFVPSVALEVIELALSPEKLNLDRIRRVPENRICAALGLHPSIVNLGSADGPSALDNGGQQAEARKAGYLDCIMPLQANQAKTVGKQFLPAYEASYRRPKAGARRIVRWCYDRVPDLQEDENRRAERIRKDFEVGIALRSEARALRGYVVDEARDAVFTDRVKVKPAKAGADDPDRGEQDREEEDED